MALNSLTTLMLHSVKRQIRRMCLTHYSTMESTKYETLTVSKPKEFINLVNLNRPKKLNAMNHTMWIEFKKCFDELAVDPDCRVIILAGSGKAFCAGIDFTNISQLGENIAQYDDTARKAKILKRKISEYQQSFTSIEKCPKPVIAAVHGACIGAGIDMISAADIRYCTSDAWFQIKEIGIGMAADVGTLQRFPKVISSDSLARELIYTARKFDANEALQCGFVNKICSDQESLLSKAIEVAEDIAKKSPIAVQTTKENLVYSRDHTVEEGLNYIALCNQVMLQSEDFANAAVSEANKDTPPVFSKL